MILTDYLDATVTCVFAIGSTAMGCLVTFEPSSMVTVSRNEGAAVATVNTTFSEEVSQPVMVVVTELLSDGTISAITVQPTLNLMFTTTGNLNCSK